jgi:hypothetical protein
MRRGAWRAESAASDLSRSVPSITSEDFEVPAIRALAGIFAFCRENRTRMVLPALTNSQHGAGSLDYADNVLITKVNTQQ